MSKVLIIDDDAGMCELLRARLQNEQFDVVVAQDGMQGINSVHRKKPDLILLDLIMPLGGGLMVLKKMKVSDHTKDIPIIVISGTNDLPLIDGVKQTDIAAYIPKPFETGALIAKIREVLSERGSPKEGA